ncbi:ABC transporter substrate-binding protein [Comamonas flocculans]|uniref:ABC transporter substrate-binding protein n=1 Tax=Comamonas flocculans TaxID=2597701 RepID=A0A5B8RVL0_9BURK|nr:ABC transporter substrate-binding protein [Comamonas flocculans]QEA13153.1 ABC transporter substrate-binding protein [Comamonas flocculans]
MQWLEARQRPGAALILAALLAASVPMRAPAQTPQPAAAPGYHIVMVLPHRPENTEAGFQDYLLKRNLNVKIDTVVYSGRAEDGPATVEKVRALAPDLIYTWGTGTTLAMAGKHDAGPDQHIRDIPIVFTEVTDPVGSGLLRQTNPPGRNVTGVSHVAPVAVQLNAMRGYLPFKRLGYITNPAESNTVGVADELRRMAGGEGFELLEAALPLDASGQPQAQALPALIRGLRERGADLLYVGPSTFLAFTHRDLVSKTAISEGLPTFCATESIVRKASCMFGLFANGTNVGRFAGYKAAQILVDKTPVERIPAESLQRFSLLINMGTAKALGLYPPLALLNVAEVVQ